MFQDKEVEKIVKYKLEIFDDTELKETDLDGITEIMVSNRDAKGKVIPINISELVKLKKLKGLDLKGFELNQDVLGVIQSFPELTSLHLYSCQSKEPISLHVKKLKSLVLDHCQSLNFVEIQFPERVLIVDGGVVDASKLQHHQQLKILGIKNSEIIHAAYLKKIPSLKSLNVDGSVLDEDNVVNQLRAKKIAVSNEFEYHPLK